MRSQPRGSSKFIRLGIGDDAAVLQPSPGCELLLTSDLLVENTHFDLKTCSPWELGAKALAASLSDIASMGGLPKAYGVSLAIPKGLKPDFFKSLYAGMRAWGQSYGAELAGGDTTSTKGPLVIDVFMLGEVEKGRALLRNRAKPGNWVFCTGTPGDSAAGLAVLQKKVRRPDKNAAALMVKRHLLPIPRILAGRFLSSHKAASACIDISDGLASELHHLASEGGVAIDVDSKAIPLSAAARRLSSRALDWVLSGGEGYELLFTVPDSKRHFVEENFRQMTGTTLALIGRVKKGSGVRIHRAGYWQKLKNTGYEHKIF